MILNKNLCYIDFGVIPDWPPCDGCHVGGIMGNEFSPESNAADDDFVSYKG